MESNEKKDQNKSNAISRIHINDYQSKSEAKTKLEQKIDTIKKGIKP